MKSKNTPIAPDDDEMQQVFDEAKEILQALHSLQGCEMALCAILDQALARDLQLAHEVYSIIDSIGRWRATVAHKAQNLLLVSLKK